MNCTKEYSAEIVEKYWEREWNKIKSMPFPSRFEHEITEQQCINEFSNLKNKDLKDGTRSSIIPKFFISMPTANKGGSLSPVEYWEKLKTDPELFKKFYENRLRCSDWFNEKDGQNRKYLDEGFVPPFIYSIGLTTSGKAPMVSYFKPSTAKNIINKYASEFNSIFDPCAGYGGRYLGTMATGKAYIGFDINDITIKENIEVKNWLEANFDVPNSNFEIKDSFNNTGTYECLFTCPPYSKPISKNKNIQIEEWLSSTGKISCQYSCDEIIDILLKNYDCQKYIIVVDETAQKYKDYIAEKITNTNYINARNGQLTEASKNYEAVVVITKEQRDNIISGDK